ncbi:hypothetical protein R5W23_005496, partial [Gemmata sp. JC673]
MPGELPIPPTNADESLRYYDPDEVALMDLRRIGVSGTGDHIQDDMGPDGSGSRRLYSCSWAERHATAIYLLGFTKTYTDSGGALRISRLLPDRHPAYDIFNWVATKCRITPYRYTGTIEDANLNYGQHIPVFERAHLEVTYELVPFDLKEDFELGEIAEREMERYVTLPGYPGADVSTQV